MKLLLIIFAAMACLPATAQVSSFGSSDTDSVNRAFAADFIRQARRLRCNVAGCSDTTRAIYDLYRDLSGEKMLRNRGITLSSRPGRYVMPQTTIDYGVLPSDSTLNTICELLDVHADSLSTEFPRSERLRSMLDTLVPFRTEMQRAFRKTVCYRIVTFYPETVYPADSMLYVTRDMLKNLEEFSKKGLEISPKTGRERNDFLAAEFSAMPSLWAPYVHRIDRPLSISAVILEDNLQRAFVNALANGTQGWGLLLERDADWHWRIVAARVLYEATPGVL